MIVSSHNMLHFKNRILSTEDSLSYFSEVSATEFSRKDYMNVLKKFRQQLPVVT